MTTHGAALTGGKQPANSTKKSVAERLVYTVPEAGQLLGLGRNAAYDAAKRGDIPTIKMGRLLRVPKAALHMLVGAELPPQPGEPNLGTADQPSKGSWR
jgi:excisionase family DNA binding protein